MNSGINQNIVVSGEKSAESLDAKKPREQLQDACIKVHEYHDNIAMFTLRKTNLSK